VVDAVQRGGAVLQKPFRRSTLVEHVRRALPAAPPAA
jgi:FixJ family two-component response regulator